MMQAHDRVQVCEKASTCSRFPADQDGLVDSFPYQVPVGFAGYGVDMRRQVL